MVSITPKMVGRTIKEYLLITFGVFIYAFAWVAIILPTGIVGGGVGGMSLLIYYVTGGVEGGIPLAYSMLAINGFLLVLATILIGFKFSTKTLYAVVMMSFAMGLLQGLIPGNILGLAGDPLLSALLAGAVSGIGITICFSQGGSTGGTDIVAMIINKFRPVSYGKVIMACDFVIIGMSFFLNNDISIVIYSYVVVAALGYTLDTLMEGNKQSSQIFIVSKYYDEVARQIVEDAHRGVTMLDAAGWYSKQQMKMVVVVVRKPETSNLLRLVRDIDPEAFITVGSVMGVYGKGFDPLTNISKGRKKRAITAAAKVEEEQAAAQDAE
ncbi:YitT family protein [Alistipes sp. OttesenSCG-928-B03]|nr:YitT family protein [Alistipes sp. OttesenSCG-928-B03]